MHDAPGRTKPAHHARHNNHEVSIRDLENEDIEDLTSDDEDEDITLARLTD